MSVCFPSAAVASLSLSVLQMDASVTDCGKAPCRVPKTPTEKKRVERKKRRDEIASGSPRLALTGPGPAHVLCAPPDSPEYLSFINSFCVAWQHKKDASAFVDIGAPEVRALSGHILNRSGSAQAAVVARELQVAMIVCRSDEHKKLFVDLGCVQAVLAALGRFPSCPEVLIQGFKALINMGKGFEAKTLIGSHGGLGLIAFAMHEWKDSDELQEIGIWVTGSIVVACPHNKILAGEAGCVDATVEAMRNFPGNIGLQQVGLWALGSLSANHSENAVRIGKRGGIGLVINAMKAFCDIPSLQEMGCWALACLAACGGKVCEKIIEKDGPATVMAAIGKQKDNANLQLAAFTALAHLGSQAANQKLLTMPAFVFFQ